MTLRICIEDRCVKIPWSGCWIWEGALSVGYGSFRRKGKTYSAHRASYENYKGSIPTGMHVLHECDVRACCNPAHLFLGTNQDNIKDSANKQRRFRSLTSKKAEMAKELRRQGFSYDTISSGIEVPTSTVYAYLRRNGL